MNPNSPDTQCHARRMSRQLGVAGAGVRQCRQLGIARGSRGDFGVAVELRGETGKLGGGLMLTPWIASNFKPPRLNLFGG